MATTQIRPATADSAIDPITLEVIRHGIVSITDQIDANITRTAFSPYIYEYKDYAVGMTDADGRLIAQCNGGMPIFVADAVGSAVRDGLKIYGKERLAKGDVVICNAPSVQGQHLNNTVMYTPIHAGPDEATLIGFFAINVHWIDIGGAAVGSASYSSTDIFMEGVQYRTIKIWSKGEPIEEIYRIIEDNTRFPQELMGDIEAQLSGCFLGRDLTRRLADKFGLDTYGAAVDLILDQCEAAVRDRIRAIPDGTYEAEAFLDNDGVREMRIPIKLRVVVAGDDMTIDYSDMPPEVEGCINSGYHGGGVTTARVAFMYLIAAGEPANEGTFRPLKLVLPEGKIVSAKPTAPMGMYGTPFPTIVDTFIKAMEKALPERVTGAPFRHLLVGRLRRAHAQRTAVQLPRFRPWRLGRLRHPRRRRPVPVDGARRHAHHPDGAAGDDLPLQLRGAVAARRFRRTGPVPRRARLRQALPDAGRMRVAHQRRPHRLPALGRARRRGGRDRARRGASRRRRGADPRQQDGRSGAAAGRSGAGRNRRRRRVRPRPRSAGRGGRARRAARLRLARRGRFGLRRRSRRKDARGRRGRDRARPVRHAAASRRHVTAAERWRARLDAPLK